MAQRLRLNVLLATTAALGTLAGCVVAPPPPPPPPAHPVYLHALSDLRAARWLIEHRPGDWVQVADEQESVRRIDAALGEIRKAAIDDGKNPNEHPPVDEQPDHRGRLRDALQYLRKARQDIAAGETNAYGNGLRDRAIAQIDGAIAAAHRVFKD
jgi:hypothetical protein